MYNRRGNNTCYHRNNQQRRNNSIPLPEDVIGSQRIQERPIILECSARRRTMFTETDMMTEWLTTGNPSNSLDTAPNFINSQQFTKFHELTQKKHDEHISEDIKLETHTRANPYEHIRNLCFVSRCGPKIASLDKMFDFAITGETEHKKRAAKTPIIEGVEAKNTLSRDDLPFIYADIGGAPGGFSDYILWRKGFFNAKGFVSFATSEFSFGYNVTRMLPGNAECLDFFTGPVENGNHNCTENVNAYVNHVKSELFKHGNGTDTPDTVDFVGAFMCLTRDGHEMSQEVRHWKMLLGNIVTGLSLLKHDTGNMLVRIFDMFTPVTVGLVYCLYLAFKQISIVKPVTCRPGNSEQFIFCEQLTPFGATAIKEYLASVLQTWDDLPDDETVTCIVPMNLMTDDSRFCEHITAHNTVTIERQMRYIQFFRLCARDQRIRVPDFDKIFKLALAHWEVKPRPRKTNNVRIHSDIECMIYDRADKNWNMRNLATAPLPYKIADTDGSATFYLTSLEFPATDFALVASDETGAVFYKSDSSKHFIQSNFVCPPFSIFLVEHNPSLFTADMNQLVVHDAAVLSDDNLSNLPLPQRLKAASKFAITAIMRNHPDASTIKFVVPTIREVEAASIAENRKDYFSSRITRTGASFWQSLTIRNAWILSE